MVSPPVPTLPAIALMRQASGLLILSALCGSCASLIGLTWVLGFAPAVATVMCSWGVVFLLAALRTYRKAFRVARSQTQSTTIERGH